MRRTDHTLYSLLAALCFLISCTTASDNNPKVTILKNSAALLRTEKLEAEARTIEEAVERILDSMARGEGSVYLGFAPDQRLKEYAWQLRKMKRDDSASKLEEYANAYTKENLKAFRLQQQLFREQQQRN